MNAKDPKKPKKKKKKRPTLTERFKRLLKFHKKIDQQLEEIYSRSGYTPEYITDYLSNPDNFTKEEWERVQKSEQDLIKNIWDALGDEHKKQYETKKKKKKAKKRRGKSIGSRKKWLRMD